MGRSLIHSWGQEYKMFSEQSDAVQPYLDQLHPMDHTLQPSSKRIHGQRPYTFNFSIK